jgi:glucose-1-phosphate cytidylyltransferase
MKVIIIAGGKGTRIMEETVAKPKPMVEIAGKPILWHIMNIFSIQGFNEFLISTGYLHEVIENWINKDEEMLDSRGNKFNVKSIFTGENTQTGGRIGEIMKKYPGERFLATYGDGLANISIQKLVNFHDSNSRLATVTAVRPPARFGYMQINNGLVSHFGEKNQADEGWINGGFFILEPGVLDYIDSPVEPFESGALAKLALDEQLTAYQHFGFWQPMDTLREKIELEKIAASNNIAWLDLVSS